MDWRGNLRRIVAENPNIDIIIVHHANGSNDFFSFKPEIERCERWRITEVCRGIIRALEEIPQKQRSDVGTSRSCHGGNTSGPQCPELTE